MNESYPVVMDPQSIKIMYCLNNNIKHLLDAYDYVLGIANVVGCYYAPTANEDHRECPSLQVGLETQEHIIDDIYEALRCVRMALDGGADK